MSDTFTTSALTADIVAAYVSKNSLSAADLPNVIREVHRALEGVAAGPAPEPSEPQQPAVPIKKSITPDHLISLEDGKKYKSLKRHLGLRGLTPDQYRAKWGLKKDYPMVAPNYSAARSELAKSMGLGQGGRGAAAKATADALKAAPKSSGRGRKKASESAQG